MRRLLLTLIFLLLHSASAQANTNITNLTDAINMAGNQRMLTQRMLKNYALAGIKDDNEKAVTALRRDRIIFEKVFLALETYDLDIESGKLLDEIYALWQPIKQKLLLPSQITEAVKLENGMDELLHAYNDLTLHFIHQSDFKGNDIINIADRQKMLSERLAALYMLQVWTIDNDSFKPKLSTAMTEFSASQNKLEQSGLTSAEIQVRLKTVRRLFKWFEIIGKTGSGRFAPLIVDRFSNKILAQMEQVTRIYLTLDAEPNQVI